jgi:hypothetical protein
LALNREGEVLMSSARNAPDVRVELKKARLKLARLKKSLERLMPFEEWCRLLKPSDCAQETYHFVRRTLQTRIREAQACVRCLAAQRPHPHCPIALHCPFPGNKGHQGPTVERGWTTRH